MKKYSPEITVVGKQINTLSGRDIGRQRLCLHLPVLHHTLNCATFAFLFVLIFL